MEHSRTRTRTRTMESILNMENSLEDSLHDDVRELIKLQKELLLHSITNDRFVSITNDRFDKGRESISKGLVKLERFENYYDMHHVIAAATQNDPNDFDSQSYQTDDIFVKLDRYANLINVSNDHDTGTLFAIVSHGGNMKFSKEEPIYAGEVKTYYQVYELKFRSPMVNLPYRVSEYKIRKK